MLFVVSHFLFCEKCNQEQVVTEYTTNKGSFNMTRVSCGCCSSTSQTCKHWGH